MLLTILVIVSIMEGESKTTCIVDVKALTHPFAETRVLLTTIAEDPHLKGDNYN